MNSNEANGITVSEGPFKWKDLIYYLKNKMVVPIIGSELYTLSHPETGKTVTLYNYLHQRLLELVDEDKRDEDYWEFMEKNKNDIAGKIKVELNAARKLINTGPLERLARITDFEYFICMTYDNYLESVLTAERKPKGVFIDTIDYSLNPKNKTFTKKESVTTIFNLMGNYNEVNGYAKTEAEILEFLYALTEGKKPASELFKNIDGKHLLFIGCAYPDWLLRFLIRILLHDNRLITAPITKVIADSRTAQDKKLCLFLNHYNSTVYTGPDATSIEFVDELYENWLAGKQEKVKYEGEVFLSYCSNDREKFVRKLYNSLKFKGVNVFFDEKEIDSGDYFSDKIQESIKASELFIPLISNESLEPNRYTRVEWEFAINADKYRPNQEKGSFIKPFVIDDTEPGDPRVTDIFCTISVKKENDINKITEFIISNLQKCQE